VTANATTDTIGPNIMRKIPISRAAVIPLSPIMMDMMLGTNQTISNAIPRTTNTIATIRSVVSCLDGMLVVVMPKV